MAKELEGRVAIVTGSALNIGRETCLKLAKLGAAVVTHAKENRDGAVETADLIVSLCRPEASYTTGQTIHVNGGAYLA